MISSLDHDVRAKEPVREALKRDIEKFLAAGGQIAQVRPAPSASAEFEDEDQEVVDNG